MKISITEMYVDEEIKNAATRVLESKRYVKGPEVREFEKEFAKFCDAEYGIATNSGTSALHVAMLTAGIKKGDEVIVPSHTFIATASPLIHIGARPIFAEIDEETYTVDVDDVRKKITDKTKAVIPVHLYGHPCDMNSLKEVADDYGVIIIEDACQAHGAEYKGDKIGGIGDIACFSFFPSKNMTVAGDGGMIVTNNEEYAIKAAALVNQGRLERKKYEHDFAGFNYRMSEILAAIGRVQLKHLSAWIEKRRKVAKVYNENLDGEVIVLPVEKEWAKHVYYVYVTRCKNRDKLREFLKEKGITTGVHYPLPVHLQPAMKDFAGSRLRITEKVAREILSLPIYPQMGTQKIEYVISCIKEWCENENNK